MQILSLWFKITAFLAMIGLLVQCTGVARDLAPWVNGFFAAKAVIDTVEAQETPPTPQAAKPPKSRAVYKLNE
jgi:hypothetical protein